MSLTRRAFLSLCAAGGTGALGAAHAGAQEQFAWRRFGDLLRARYTDPRRHFVFDYYPWYAADPFRHWTMWHRVPPVDLAANTMPLLGAYDSRSRAVVEQHARWIAESGVGVINISWWGQGSFSDRAVPLIMDVMADHDIKVAFPLEPYNLDRATRMPEDVLYLLREFGERRRWDCFYFNERADRTQGPVFKLFRTAPPQQVENCRGELEPVADFVLDSEWRRQVERLRSIVADDFDHLTLLSNTSKAERVAAQGMDGISVYDPADSPDQWLDHALVSTRVGVLFAFPLNPGQDYMARRVVEDPCYVTPPFLPAVSEPIDWTRPEEREMAARLAENRMEETLQANLMLQTHPFLGNVDQGFFLVHITSFNEWHEGHQFEPMKDDTALTDAERAVGYHNPADGAYRLRKLTDLLGRL